MNEDTIPGFKLNHTLGVWESVATGEQLNSVTFVFIEDNRSRTMWHPTIPKTVACSSADGVIGSPRDVFPWDMNAKTKDAVDPETGLVSCDLCPFKSWDGPWTRPPCSITFSMAALYAPGTDSEVPVEEMKPCVVLIRGSALKEINEFRHDLAKKNEPWFTLRIGSTPMMQSTKGRRYAVPKFSLLASQEVGEVDIDFIESVADRVQEQIKRPASRKGAPDVKQGLKSALNITTERHHS